MGERERRRQEDERRRQEEERGRRQEEERERVRRLAQGRRLQEKQLLSYGFYTAPRFFQRGCWRKDDHGQLRWVREFVWRKDDHDAAAKVAFLPDWRHVQVGEIRAGSPLVIAYDDRRWPPCCWGYRPRQEARPFNWWMDVIVRFHPHAREFGYSAPEGSLVLWVPSNAQRIELWFKSSYHRGHYDWDSRYAQNYWFDVAPA